MDRIQIVRANRNMRVFLEIFFKISNSSVGKANPGGSHMRASFLFIGLSVLVCLTGTSEICLAQMRCAPVAGRPPNWCIAPPPNVHMRPQYRPDGGDPFSTPAPNGGPPQYSWNVRCVVTVGVCPWQGPVGASCSCLGSDGFYYYGVSQAYRVPYGF